MDDNVGANTATSYDTRDHLYSPGKAFLINGRKKVNKRSKKKGKSGKETIKKLKIFKYYCTICKERIPRRLMGLHVDEQHPGIIFQCVKCSDVFTYPGSTHIRRKHAMRTITKEVLTAYYKPVPRSKATPRELLRLKWLESLMAHRLAKTRAKQNLCIICNEVVKISGLRRHSEEKHAEIIMQCKTCSDVFTFSSRQHLRQSHGLKGVTLEELKEHYRPLAISHATPEQLRRIDWLKSKGTPKTHQPNDVLPSHSVSKRPSEKLILPSITMFNCHDCQACFRKMPDLFDHCRNHHRHFVNGKPGRYLVPVKMLNRE